MSLAFMIGAVVLTVVANVVILRYFLRRPLDTPFEEITKPPASQAGS
jgi:hypothetical protein